MSSSLDLGHSASPFAKAFAKLLDDAVGEMVWSTKMSRLCSPQDPTRITRDY